MCNCNSVHPTLLRRVAAATYLHSASSVSRLARPRRLVQTRERQEVHSPPQPAHVEMDRTSSSKRSGDRSKDKGARAVGTNSTPMLNQNNDKLANIVEANSAVLARVLEQFQQLERPRKLRMSFLSLMLLRYHHLLLLSRM